MALILAYYSRTGGHFRISLRDSHATLYGPMDHVNYSEETIELTRKYHKIIALCKWQQKCLADIGIESDCIYHGVNVNIFRPMNKKESRKKIGITKDNVFIFGTVAANEDIEDRKGHTKSIKAMRYFLDQNTDVKNVFGCIIQFLIILEACHLLLSHINLD